MAKILMQPSIELQEHIRTKLKENIITRDGDLQVIKEWLLKQPHLPNTWDEDRLLTFLRGCKFSLEKTKHKLDMYFTMRNALPEIFSNRNINNPELAKITKFINIPPLPIVTPIGHRVIVMRGLDKNRHAQVVTDAMKIVLMIADVRLSAEEAGIAGDVYILDSSIATPAHFARFTPAIVKKFFVCVQEAYPIKLKQVHVINVSPLVDQMINFVKPFLKEKIRKRIHVHQTLDTLYEFVPKDILPIEYGGSAGKLQDFHDQWIKTLEENQEWFDDQEYIKADESKRPGMPKKHDDLFGMEGSFRKLLID